MQNSLLSGHADIKVVDEVIYLIGMLNFNTVVSLRKRGDEYLIKQAKGHFNFKDVTHCDSAALTLLTTWTRLARHLKKEIIFTELPEQLLDLVKLARLENLIPLH